MSFIQCSEIASSPKLRKLLGTCAWLIGAKIASLMRASFLSKVLEPAPSQSLGFSVRLTIALHDSCSLLKHQPAILLFLGVSCNRQRSILKPLSSYCRTSTRTVPPPGPVSTLTQHPPYPPYPPSDTGEIFARFCLEFTDLQVELLIEGSDSSLFFPPR